MKTQIELLPCPFCRSNATLENYRTIYVVQCCNKECSALILGERSPEPNGKEPDSYWEKLRQSAIDRWNKRI